MTDSEHKVALSSRNRQAVLSDLVKTCEKLRQLINTQNPLSLIGYFYSIILLSFLNEEDTIGENIPRPSSAIQKELLLAMEYIHAVIATDGILIEDFKHVDLEVADKIQTLAATVLNLCLEYEFTHHFNPDGTEDRANQRLNFEILTTWVMIRGRRYTVLEEDFFNFVLKPHDNILLELYGVDSNFIAKEMQKYRTLRGAALRQVLNGCML